MMKSVLLVVLLAAAATAAVVSNDVPDVVVLPEEADVDVNEGPKVSVTHMLEHTAVKEATDAAEETAVATRRNLAIGTIAGNLIYDAQHIAVGVPGKQISKDITVFTGGRITAIFATRIGATQNANPHVLSGGIGSSFVTLRIQSATGYGFHYWVEIYAK